MTTVKAWLFIPKVWNMLRQLSSSHDNGQSMVIHHSSMKHASSVVILHENGQSMVIYHSSMKHAPSVVSVTWQRSEHGYSSLRYETCSVSCHRDRTTVRAWLFIPKVWNMLVSCHRDMTTVRAWSFISKVWNMLRQLSSWHDNGQSMVIHP